MAPEVVPSFQMRAFDGKKLDLWGVGVIIFMVVTGERPWLRPWVLDEKFHALSGPECMCALRSLNLGLSEEIMALFQGMFRIVPENRLDAEQILYHHPWLNRPEVGN